MTEEIKCPICGLVQSTHGVGFCRKCKFALYAYKESCEEDRTRLVEKFMTDYPKYRNGKGRDDATPNVDTKEPCHSQGVGSACCSGPNEVLVKKIKWPLYDGRFDDVKFELPRYALAVYVVTKILDWVVAIAIAIGTIISMFNGAPLTLGILIIICTAIGLAIALYAARIVYELMILFYEQLKTMRQIRDFLSSKLS